MIIDMLSYIKNHRQHISIRLNSNEFMHTNMRTRLLNRGSLCDRIMNVYARLDCNTYTFSNSITYTNHGNPLRDFNKAWGREKNNLTYSVDFSSGLK